MATLQQLVDQEAVRYGVPTWIAEPLVTAESNWNPGAVNQGHYGLLQLDPRYWGAPGANLLDPTTNLDAGLPAIGAAYRSAGSPNESLGAFESVTAAAGWESNQTPQSAANYERAYAGYTSGPAPTVSQANIGINPFGSIPFIGPDINLTPPTGGLNFGQNPLQSLQNLQHLTDVFGWLKDHPLALIVVMGAGALFIASAMHLATGKTPIQVISSGSKKIGEAAAVAAA